MTKRENELLGLAFAKEVESAITGGAHVIQTKSKLAKKLVGDGFLREVEITMPGRFPVRIKGHELTEAGRLMYCTSCA